MEGRFGNRFNRTTAVDISCVGPKRPAIRRHTIVDQILVSYFVPEYLVVSTGLRRGSLDYLRAWTHVDSIRRASRWCCLLVYRLASWPPAGVAPARAARAPSGAAPAGADFAFAASAGTGCSSR